jgi:hypothetical protein
MIELWSQEQMNKVLTQERCHAIQDKAVDYESPNKKRVDFKDGGYALIVDSDPFRLVVSCENLLAAIEWKDDAWEVYQVQHKTVMVPQSTYESVRKRPARVP